MPKTKAQIIAEAQVVKNATEVGENTATRVGGVLEDLADADSVVIIPVTGTSSGGNITLSSNPFTQVQTAVNAGQHVVVRVTYGSDIVDFTMNTYSASVATYIGTANFLQNEFQLLCSASSAVITNRSTSNTFSTGESVPNVGIDATPTQGSNNLVKSGGVWSAMQLVEDIDAVKSISQKKERLLSWKEVMDGNMYTLTNTFTANIEDSGNIIIGKGLSIFKNEAGTASANLSIRFPYSADLYMSWWAADRGKTGNTGSTLSIMVLQTTQINASHVAGTITGRIRFNLPKTSGITITNVLNAINTNGYYEYPAANIAKNQSYVSDFTSNPYTSIAIRITDYRIIDGNYYWHYDVHIEGLYETSFCAFGVEQSMAWVAGQTLFVSNLICQSLPIDNSSAQIEQEKWSNIVNGVDFPKVAYNYNQNNEIIDQFDDVGNQLAINTSTLTSWKQPTAYFYHILKSEFTKAKTDVSVADPYSGNTLKIPAYRYTNGGNAITFYYNANNFHPFINIIPQTRMSGKKYTAQLWVDLSELNGNAICRGIGTAMIMIDLRMAFEGMRYNITLSSDGYKFHDEKVYCKIVKRIGNLICLRFFDVETYGLKLALFSVSATAVTQLTIYNPTLIEGERVEIDAFHVYQSESQRQHPQWRGKSVLLLGDSQYNNYIVAYNLVSRLGVNIYDGHYGGHSMRYNDTTAVNPTSKSWFYQLTYRKLILSANVDAYLLTCSTNDTPATGSELSASTLADVLANYPEYKDFDTAAETSKMTTFNSLTTAQRQAIFTYMPTYAAYIRQMYEAHPYAKFFLCSVPISCSGRLTGTAVPDPANPSESIGEWKEGQSADVARAALMNGFISMRDKIKYLADWTNAQFIDLFREAGLTFDNFIYHCQDGTHWHIDISQNCADAIINEIG